jgi:hypothetical protein
LKRGLTSEQQRLVGRILKLHRAGEPLNIHAVRRRHPDLLARVMAVEPYWGWRRALEAAGIAYGDFPEELTETVTCQLCGKVLSALNSHLPRKHGVSAEDYRDEFPDAEIVCERLRVMRSKKQLDAGEYALPHWERVWSFEYVLDRIARRWELGHPLTSVWTEAHDPNLMHQAFIKGKSWEECLLAAGVDPETTRLIRILRDASDGWLIGQLKKRHAADVPLSETHVRRVQPSFHAEVAGRFGTWSKGLARAGIRPADAATVPDPARLTQMMGAARAVAALPDERRCSELRAFQARWETFALASLGSWRRVAEDAGVPVDRLHRSHMEHVYQSPRALLDEIKRRYRAGIPFHKSAVDNGPDGVRDYAINDAACRFFGTYRKAILAAAKAEGDPGLRQAGIRPLRLTYADENAVVAEISRRAREGLTLFVNDLVKEDNALYRASRRYFPDWRAAIRAAGLSPDELGLGHEQRRGVRPRYPDAKSVLAEIRRRSKLGLPVNAHAVAAAGPEPDGPLLVFARRHFQKWENALRAAGIDPASVVSRSS